MLVALRCGWSPLSGRWGNLMGDVQVTVLDPQQTFYVQAHADIQQLTAPSGDDRDG